LIDDPFDHSLVAQMVEANERASGCAIGEGRPWGEQIVTSLRTGLDGWCIHSLIRDHSGKAAALLDRIEAIGRSVEPDDLPVTDLVHGDYHHRNVLLADGRITGVIDCEACLDGDRRFDLVTLAYWLGFVGAEPGVAEALTALTVELVPAELLAAYRAHMVVRNIDFYLRTGRPDVADMQVDYGAGLVAL
jgi:aminoglycoside phosphotransferase (APT) family kinase protein